MKKIQIGYIGSGPISNFHIPALKKAGFEVRLFYSRNYIKACNFSKVNKIIFPEKSFKDFLNKSKNLDAFILSIKSEVTAKYLMRLCQINKPIFVEKPGSLKSVDLIKIKKKRKSKIFFLYNRRFYPSIIEGKKFIDSSKQCFVNVKIPDTIKTLHWFISNGSHIIDLLIFYFKDLKVVNSYKLKKNIGYYFLLKSKNNDMISCLLNWGSPQNFEVDICNEKNLRLEIKPIESAYLFDKMKKIEPTKEHPIRSYIPKLVKKKLTVYKGMKYKPGFLEQYKEIKKIIQSDKKDHRICTLDEAIKVLHLIETIIKKSKSN